MAVVDMINEMKKKGVSEGEIVKTLQDQGYSPEEINYSLAQSNIKPGAPAPQYPSSQPPMPPQPGFQQQQQNMPPRPNNQMQPSVMSPPQPTQDQTSHQQQPITQEIGDSFQPDQYDQPPQQGYDQNDQQQGYDQYAPQEQSQQGYDQYEQYTPSSSDTMTEIAEEIVDEKIMAIEHALKNLVDLKTEFDLKTRSLNERVKKIEDIIDKLQLAILRKITMYGQDMEDIKTEITKTQESFSKVLNPLVDEARKVPTHQPTHKKHKSKKHKKSGKKKAPIEHYLRR